MKKNITIIPGDGVGPEVTQQSVKVLDAVAARFNHQFNYTSCQMGAAAFIQTVNELPNTTIESCLYADAVLSGPIATVKHNNGIALQARPGNSLQRLIKILRLFASVQPVVTYSSLYHLSPLKARIVEGVDLVIFRELSGEISSDKNKPDDAQTWASDTVIYTHEEISRIAHMAFKSAQQRKKKLTVAGKPNLLQTSALWQKIIKQTAKEYTDVQVNFLPVNTATRQIILTPSQFDVVLTDTLSGNILNDAAGAVGGSSGLLPCAFIGNSNALFVPVHGAVSTAAGKDIANPFGSVLSAAMMLDYFNLKQEAHLVRNAVKWTIESLFVSKDLDPVNFYFTSTIGELVSEYISGRISGNVNKENIALRKSTII